MEPFKLTIHRNEWARGRFNRPASDCFADKLQNHLINPGLDTKCCLGCFGLACGISRESLLNMGMPAGLFSNKMDYDRAVTYQRLPVVFKPLLTPDDFHTYRNSDLAVDLARINDDERIDEDTRELLLASKFKEELNVEVTFVD